MAGDTVPQPKDPEIIKRDEILKKMQAIANALNLNNYPRAEKGHEQFGNNFVCLFEAIRKEKSDPNLGIVKIYLREKAEKLHGDKWGKFLEDNADLMAQIQEVLKEKEPYEELAELLRSLYGNKKTWDPAERAYQEIDYERFGVYIWNKLNPLLEHASKRMIQYGINPEVFYT